MSRSVSSDRLTRARWLAARTRNAVRHGLLIGAVSCLVTLVAILTFVLAPRQADRALAAALSGLPVPRDTQALLSMQRAAGAQRDALQARLDSLRAAVAASVASAAAPPSAAAPMAGDVTTPSRAADSTLDASSILALERALERARQAPLVESYRVLVTETVLQRDAAARATLDSIEQVHREREAYAALGGPDARYAALTTRLTGLGDRLLAMGARRLRLPGTDATPTRAEGAPYGARGNPDVHADSVLDAALRDAILTVRRTDSILGAARLFNKDVAAARAVVRDRFALTIPPVAALLASLILGMSAGFGAALWREMRRPTVGDALELESLTGARVIVHRAGGTPRGDTGGDAGGDAWPLLHLSLTHVGDMSREVEILCDQPLIAAAVGVHLAAVAARESRETALVDLAERGGPLRALLPAASLQRADAPAEASVALHWDTRRAMALGRDTAVDLVRARSASPLSLPPTPSMSMHAERTASDELGAILASYDFAVLVADRRRGTVHTGAETRTADVVLCARLGVTSLAWIGQAQRHMREQGRRVRAVVLWTGALPAAPWGIPSTDA